MRTLNHIHNNLKQQKLTCERGKGKVVESERENDTLTSMFILVLTHNGECFLVAGNAVRFFFL